MAGFSSSTYAILYSKLRSLTTGISNITASGNQIVFTLNDGSTQTLTIPNQLTTQEKHDLVQAIPMLNKMVEDANGRLTYDGKLLLSEEDLSKANIKTIQDLLKVLQIDTDGKAILNGVKVTTDGTDIFMNGETVVFTKDETTGDIDFDTDITW